MVRAFVAVDAPAVEELAIAQRKLFAAAGWDGRSIKPVSADNFHFTLQFLGEIDSHDRFAEKLASISFKPFQLRLEGMGAFPSADSARVLWVGVDAEDAKSLAALAGQVTQRMRELGYTPDKPFSPHLTIARARDRPLRARQALAQFEGIAIGSGIIDRFHLKKSDLRPAGPVYSNVYTVVGLN